MTMLGFWPPETKTKEAMLGARAVLVRGSRVGRMGRGLRVEYSELAVYSGAVVDGGVDAEVGWSCCTSTDL